MQTLQKPQRLTIDLPAEEEPLSLSSPLVPPLALSSESRLFQDQKLEQQEEEIEEIEEAESEEVEVEGIDFPLSEVFTPSPPMTPSASPSASPMASPSASPSAPHVPLFSYVAIVMPLTLSSITSSSLSSSASSITSSSLSTTSSSSSVSSASSVSPITSSLSASLMSPIVPLPSPLLSFENNDNQLDHGAVRHPRRYRSRRSLYARSNANANANVNAINRSVVRRLDFS